MDFKNVFCGIINYVIKNELDIICLWDFFLIVVYIFQSILIIIDIDQ